MFPVETLCEKRYNSHSKCLLQTKCVYFAEMVCLMCVYCENCMSISKNTL